MPKAIKGNFSVCRDTRSVRVYAWKHPKTGKRAWRFAVPDPEAKSGWRYVTSATKDLASAAAEKWLDEQPSGFVWMTLPPERRRYLEAVHRQSNEADAEAVLAFLASRKRSADIGAAVATFLAHKQEKAGEETPHLARVKGVLDEIAVAFAGRAVADIHSPDLKEWWDGRVIKLGWKRKNDIRTHLVMFWSWCQVEQLLPGDKYHVAHRLPTSGSVYAVPDVYTPAEFLELAAAVEPADRPNIVLGAFFGLRPEECFPAASKKAQKRGLSGADIDWRFHTIQLPAGVSKGGRKPRRIPMTEAGIAWLKWAGIEESSKGTICIRNLVEAGETLRLGKLFGGWRQDALRHSYASYRNSTLRNRAKVAEEMGTSEKLFDRNYHHPLPAELGEEWFSLRPEMIRCDPMKRTFQLSKEAKND